MASSFAIKHDGVCVGDHLPAHDSVVLDEYLATAVLAACSTR
jgi:hypothetical protein